MSLLHVGSGVRILRLRQNSHVLRHIQQCRVGVETRRAVVVDSTDAALPLLLVPACIT